MALADVVINRGNGNLGGTLSTRDGDCGLLFIDSRWSSPVAVTTIYSVKELEDLGVTSTLDDHAGVVHYHVSKYFEATRSPLTITCVASDANYDKITEMQLAANGNIAIFGVFDNVTTWATAKIEIIQTRLASLEAVKTPACALYSAYLGLTGTVENTITDLTLLTAYRVGVTVGEDVLAGSKAATLRAASNNKFVGTIGLDLGILSRNRLNDNIGWKELNPIGGFIGQAGFIDGTKVKAKTLAMLNTLDGKHATFLTNGPQGVGIYYNFDYTASPETNDYHTMTLNRVWDKVFRLTYKALYPKLNSTVVYLSDGKLTAMSVKVMTNAVESQLVAMVASGEISGFSVYCDPDQLVQQTKKLTMTISIQPTGVVKTIDVTTQFTLTL